MEPVSAETDCRSEGSCTLLNQRTSAGPALGILPSPEATSDQSAGSRREQLTSRHQYGCRRAPHGTRELRHAPDTPLRARLPTHAAVTTREDCPAACIFSAPLLS